MIISEYSKDMKLPLANLMADYMAELGSNIPEDVIRGQLSDFIDTMCERGIIRICIAYDCGNPVAFSVFQIDTPESDWCNRPGWGFIREYYVIPHCRKKGIGKALADHTEQELKNMGADNLYLTSTGAISFWQKWGWKLTGETTENGQAILVKSS